MIQVLTATNRKDSRSKQVAKIVVEKLKAAGAEAEIMLLEDVNWGDFNSQEYGPDAVPESIKGKVAKIDSADGVYVVCPEYNGSFPGAIKFFIDYWSYPASFESRPVCFTGLGGMFGGLRPVEQLEQVFGYRNAFIFPERIFLQNVWLTLKDGVINNDVVDALLNKQTKNFTVFIKALKDSGLHANVKPKEVK